MSEKYKALKVKELQELLQKNGLSTSGKKEELVARLVKDDERKALESLEKEFELDGDFDESKTPVSELATDDIFALEKLPLKESVLSDDEDVDFIFNEKKTTKSTASSAPATSPSSTAASPIASISATETVDTVVKQTETPKINSTNSAATITATVKTTVSSTFKFTPITFDKKPSIADTASTPIAATTTVARVITSKPKAAAAAAVAAAKATSVPPKSLDDKAEKLRLEAERRLERSKRFGVKLDEKEMKEIRAARFGIATTTANADSKTTPTAAKNSNKSKETTGNNKENGKKKKRVSTDAQKDMLKKRAERFGLPEKKMEEKEKQGKKTNSNAKNNSKKAVVSTVKAPALKKIQKGRITKANPPATATKNKKNITVNVTKYNVLSKKQKNVNMLNKGGIILQNKKNIINQRKVNMVNKDAPKANNGRVITIAPKITKSTPTTTLKRKRDESNATASHIGRTVTVNSSTKANQRNSNNNATGKRGPGGRQRNVSFEHILPDNVNSSFCSLCRLQ
ncbi:hypothetical protein BD408DRAFT_412482 [Parasitella parasitica]|nr:hypothetical protein BD408DRAFT_412482 [Parasitella parasitica]